jgi:hypothetical protein
MASVPKNIGFVPEKSPAVTRANRLALARLKRTMILPKRAYLQALVAENFHIRNANEFFWRTGYKATHGTLYQWRKNPEFARAMRLEAEQQLIKYGPSTDKVLLNVMGLADHGAEKIAVRNKKGELILDENGQPVMTLRDPSLSLKANELVGKHLRLWGDDEAASRITVQLVNLTGGDDDDAIEAEYQ